jgi:hypothetical protein
MSNGNSIPKQRNGSDNPSVLRDILLAATAAGKDRRDPTPAAPGRVGDPFASSNKKFATPNRKASRTCVLAGFSGLAKAANSASYAG